MSPAQAAPQSSDRSLSKEALWSGLHLAVLWTFAVAQPLFDLLGDNPEFFAARGSSGGDIISFALLLVLVPPLVLLAIELLASLASREAGRAVHLLFIALLVALIAVQALKKAIDASDVVLMVASLLIGAGVAALYARTQGARSFMSVLSPAPLVFLALFLFGSPVSKLAFPDEASARTVGGVTRAPIVMVLFDELPGTSLLGRDGNIDGQRFPGFAALAADATFFPNAYAVYDSTERAQPAIMDGNYPEEDKLPTSSDHPNSIFSLFAKTHRLNVSEEATSVCSRELCRDERLDESYASRMSSMGEDLGLVWLHVVAPPEIEQDLASVSENWGNFGGGGDGGGEAAAADDDQSADVRSNLNRNRNKRFDAWVSDVDASSRPGLHFKHTLLPHVPWQYLPSGKQYRRTARDPVPGLSSEAYEDQGQLDSLLQRHILQTGFADLELRKLIRKLKREGIYDDALIVVAADHGVAFQRGKRDRRKLTRSNAAEVASVPLIVKAPGQKRGRRSGAHVETVDILPTIFDVLELDPKVKMDGRSAFSERVRGRRTLRILERGSFKPIRIPAAEFERERQAVIDRNLRLLGSGSDGPERIYRIGPRPELLGRPARSAGNGRVKAELVGAAELARVDLRSPTVPVHLVARLSGGAGGSRRDVAIAVNGVVRATGRSFALATDRGQELVAALVPPSSFKQGRNRVEIFEVAGGGELRRLGGT
ncbi:MAG TPA: sulfatase-like hydrolase/transferase [Thermoleophilaceae bacterium]|nr:sulfatase-like hydrolase/transferase [Thermoleophilaceae bacterium]